MNRANGFDTVYTGSISAGDGRIDYMVWNHSAESVDFNSPIDNSFTAITGNIIDTTVSDERLKTNIQVIQSNYCDCIRNVKIKSF